MNKPDVILVCDLGKTASAVKFNLSSELKEPVFFAPDGIQRFIALCRQDGYDHYRLLGEAYDARICVRPGFDVGTAREMAKHYLTMVREALT